MGTGSSSFVASLPPEFIARFRAVSLERIQRMDAAWQALVAQVGTPADGETLAQELHTLKGDARIVGLADAGLLCERLEDILAAARQRRFRVHEDVDIVVTMALQFLEVLVRRKPGMVSGGIDLDGFLKELEAVASEWLRHSSSLPVSDTTPGLRRQHHEEVVPAAPSLREQLGGLGTDVYLEHLRAEGYSRTRLRAIFEGIARAVRDLSSVPIAPIVEQQLVAAQALARELGKTVETLADVGAIRFPEPLRETVNVSLLHLLRNAVDHGIEPPAERAEKGVGKLRITARERDGELELRVEDDGAGIDVAVVKARAISLGIVAVDATMHEDDWLRLVFRDGFSTRDVATPISGRGVGLSAVRAEVEKCGGRISVSATPKHGSRFVIRLPVGPERIDVQLFGDPRLPAAQAVGADWEVAPCPVEECHDRFTELLDIPAGQTAEYPDGVELRRDPLRIRALVPRGVVRASVSRVCPGAPSRPCEVVRFGTQDVLLVRPEVLPAKKPPQQ